MNFSGYRSDFFVWLRERKDLYLLDEVFLKIRFEFLDYMFFYLNM